MPERARQTAILPLTSARIFAALYVVLLHSFLWTHRLDTSTWMGRFIRNGYTAVGFFFTLSGFILAHVYLRSGRPLDRRSFWVSRFARVYPLLLASLLLDAPRVLALLMARNGALAGGLTTGVILLGESLLLQSWSHIFRAINAPSWSLSAEAGFYLAFPFVAFWVWRWRRGEALALFVLLWLCALAAPALVTLQWPELFVEVDGSRLQSAVELMPVFRIFEFLAGIPLCGLQHSVIAPWPPGSRSRFAWMALGGAALLFIFAIDASNHVPLLVMSDGFLLPVYGLTILGLANARGWLEGLLSRPAFVLLGESSYAVYLLHSPLFFYCAGIHPMEGAMMWSIYLALVLGVSIASFLLLERPIRRWMLAFASVRPAVTLAQESIDPR